MYLHGNKIAWKDGNGNLYFSMCGWATPTTRERLNGLGIRIYQYKFMQIYKEERIQPELTYKHN